MDYKDFTEEEFREVFNKFYDFDELAPKKYEWEEDGKFYSCWKMGSLYTNDAGKKAFDEAVKKSFEK